MVRVRAKMATAVELAAVLGTQQVDQALGPAAFAGRFDEGHLAPICDYLAAAGTASEVVVADEAHSAQPGTSSWERLGR